MTEGGWPLIVGPVQLIPAGRGGSDEGGTLHLTRQIPATGLAGAEVVTLCGRRAFPMSVDASVEVFSRDRDRLCGSCWRIVEGWLEPPGVAAGEDLVVAWLVETVLTGGSAMVEDVPFGRVRAMRQRVRREIKAAIGGTVTTAMVSPTTIWVYSPLVIDAKTEEQHHREMRDAMLRLEAGEDGRRVGQSDWRRSWSQVIASRG